MGCVLVENSKPAAHLRHEWMLSLIASYRHELLMEVVQRPNCAKLYLHLYPPQHGRNEQLQLEIVLQSGATAARQAAKAGGGEAAPVPPPPEAAAPPAAHLTHLLMQHSQSSSALLGRWSEQRLPTIVNLPPTAQLLATPDWASIVCPPAPLIPVRQIPRTSSGISAASGGDSWSGIGGGSPATETAVRMRNPSGGAASAQRVKVDTGSPSGCGANHNVHKSISNPSSLVSAAAVSPAAAASAYAAATEHRRHSMSPALASGGSGSSSPSLVKRLESVHVGGGFGEWPAVGGRPCRFDIGSPSSRASHSAASSVCDEAPTVRGGGEALNLWAVAAATAASPPHGQRQQPFAAAAAAAGLLQARRDGGVARERTPLHIARPGGSGGAGTAFAGGALQRTVSEQLPNVRSIQASPQTPSPPGRSQLRSVGDGWQEVKRRKPPKLAAANAAPRAGGGGGGGHSSGGRRSMPNTR